MILAEKIMSLRKRNGWSQEELANQLGVSRQSVSKWESAASVPDLSKITQMSEIFGVTTDYLLKDEVDDMQPLQAVLEGSVPPAEGAGEEKAHPVTLEEANDYMELAEKTAPKTALGVMLCIWSPILLIILGGVSEINNPVLSENAAAAIGITGLLLLIAAAVCIFIMKSSKLDKYEYMEKEMLDLQYGVEAAVKRKKEAFENVYRLSVAIGVAGILLAVAQFIAIGALTEGKSELIPAISLAIMLFVIGICVFLFVKNGVVTESYHKLLQEEDYAPEKKQIGKKIAWFPGAYWGLATAIYLGISFITESWDRSWIVWPVAGVLFAALYAILFAVAKNQSK